MPPQCSTFPFFLTKTFFRDKIKLAQDNRNAHVREKENAMTTLKAFVRSTISVLAALLLIALAAGIGFFGPITRAAFGETTAQSVSLVEIGNSFTTEDGGKSMPIFAVMVGNRSEE